MTVLWVALGAVAGAPLRMLADRLAVARRGRGSVLGTLAVNVLGSALLGGLAGARGVSPVVLALVGTGFCGTLTTFSTFAYDLVRLIEERHAFRAVADLVGSLALGLGAATIGYLLVGG